MSVHVLSAFMEESRSTLGSRLVGMVLSDSAWDDGITWLPIEKIAVRTRLSERQVYRCLIELEELGELEKRKAQRGRKRMNVYRLSLGASVPQYERLPIEIGDPFTLDRLTNSQVVTVPRPDTHVTDDLTPTSGNTSIARKDHVRELATAPSARPRDLIWDELTERFGAVAEKTNAHAKRNKATTDLKRLGATPTEIGAAVAAWPRVFPGATLTDIALATHWPQLITLTVVRSTRPVEDILNLPDITEEERLANVERLRELAGSIGQEVA